MASATRSGSAENAARAIDVSATRDRDLLRGFLERDRLRAAYAICDLDPREFGKTKWGVAFERGEPIAVVLEYGGLTPQPLFVMGDPDGVAAILRDTDQAAPGLSRRRRNASRCSRPAVPHRPRAADGAHGGQSGSSSSRSTAP